MIDKQQNEKHTLSLGSLITIKKQNQIGNKGTAGQCGIVVDLEKSLLEVHDYVYVLVDGQVIETWDDYVDAL